MEIFDPYLVKHFYFQTSISWNVSFVIDILHRTKWFWNYPDFMLPFILVHDLSHNLLPQYQRSSLVTNNSSFPYALVLWRSLVMSTWIKTASATQRPPLFNFSSRKNAAQNYADESLSSCSWTLGWRVLCLENFHTYAITVLRPSFRLTQKRNELLFSKGVASFLLLPRRYIICTGNIYTGTGSAGKIRQSTIFLEENATISLTESFAASAALLDLNMFDPRLKYYLVYAATMVESDLEYTWCRSHSEQTCSTQ